MISRLRSILYILITGFFFCNASVARAGEGSEGHALSARIAKAHLAGTIFQEVSLFAPATASKHTSLLEKETILQPLGERISDLYESKPQAISLTLRSDEGREYKLEMLRAHPTAERANMGYIDATGRHKTGFDEGLHYQGSIAGTEQSLAAMSVFANGDIMLLFANGDGNFVVGRLEDGSGKYILYNDREMKSRPYTPCGVSDNAYKASGNGTNAKTAKAMQCKKVQLYWEVSYNVFTSKASSLTTTQTYVTGVFNQFQAMYANEAIAMELKSMYIWTAPDDYPTASSSAALDKFKRYWNDMGDNFDGDIAHLLTRDNAGNGGGNGGLAYLDVLCGRQFAYGYSDIYGTYQTIPTFSWDVEVLTHETGHNLGSHHTHWCGWLTGTGGSCGSIDNCYTQESTTGCTTCGSTYLNSASTTLWKGTVMSYCHLVARGINLANGFGQLPGAVIRSKVSAGSCLKPSINAALTSTPICTNDGTVSLIYAANNFGTAPYTYNWSNNLHTQNLAGISTPGTYGVQVTDSNGCLVSYTAEVIRRPDAGNGIAPVQEMPICCNSSTIPLILNATAPKDLTNCQSVYWLRSSVPLSNYADAKGYFDTTQAANILASTNSSSISNNATGAALNILPPANCATKLTYYYTPVAVALPHAADSFVYGPASGTIIAVLGTQIGSYVALPDQTGLPTACDLLDTPVSQNLTVIVTGYTGRANKMRIAVLDASNQVLYERFGLAGNGTYSIPASSIPGSLLQALELDVYDYNCTSVSCTTALATISVSRKVVFGTRPSSVTPGCKAGTSVRVDFAPNGCTKLGVENPGAVQSKAAALYPNPASKSVTLKFTADAPGAVQLKVTDMLGKTIFIQEAAYSTGLQQQVIDVHSWAKGIYFVNITGSRLAAERLKLVVE